MPEAIKVISQNPPGGRCTLYALYSFESKIGFVGCVIRTMVRTAHPTIFHVINAGGMSGIGSYL